MARWKKKKPSGRRVTDWEIQQVEKRLNAKLEKSKWEAESEATAFVYAIMFKALFDTMDFTIDDLAKLQGGIDIISTQMINGELSIHDIKEELVSKGVGFLEEEKR